MPYFTGTRIDPMDIYAKNSDIHVFIAQGGVYQPGGQH